MLAGIYKITNKINNKIYIGSSSDIKGRWATHISTKNGFLINRAIRKYGAENFIFEIVETVNSLSSKKLLRKILIETEQKYLDLLQPWSENNGYNICRTAGSTLGTKKTEEQRRKLSDRQKELGIGKWNKGRSPWNKDIPCSEERKKNISEAKKAQNLKGSKNPKSKSVIMLDPVGNIVFFESINTGSEEHGLNPRYISRIINRHRYQYKGWRLYNEDEVGQLPINKRLGRIAWNKGLKTAHIEEY